MTRLATRPLRVGMFVTNDMRFDSRVRRAAAAVAADGHSVTVYAVRTEAKGQVEPEAIDGYTIVRTPMLTRTVPTADEARSARRTVSVKRLAAAMYVTTRPAFGGTLHLLLTWRFRWQAWGARVARVAQPADVWHAHDLNTLGTALLCAKRMGGKVIYDSHEIFTEAGANALLPGAVRHLMRRFERAWAQQCAAVITVNESVASHLREALDVPSIAVVHNCAIPPAQRRSPLRARLGLEPHTKLVLYHGSVTSGRGLDPLIRAMELPSLEGTHLAIMGYGPARPALEALAARSEACERIHFLPQVRPEILTEWVSDADVAAMPIEPVTLNHRLSSPNKLFEALAAGVPVVGPDFPEFRRVVAEDPERPLGRLHQGHQPVDIARAIVEVLDLDEEATRALRSRCLEAARTRWTWDRERLALLKVYGAVTAPEAVAVARPDTRVGDPLFADH